MRTLAHDFNREGIGGRGQRSGLGNHLTYGEPAVDVSTKNRPNTIQHPAFKNRRRTIPDVLGRLQHDQDITACRVLRE